MPTNFDRWTHERMRGIETKFAPRPLSNGQTDRVEVYTELCEVVSYQRSLQVTAITTMEIVWNNVKSMLIIFSIFEAVYTRVVFAWRQCACPHIGGQAVFSKKLHNCLAIAFSPDLAPCDCFLFPKIKLHLRQRRFDFVEEIQAESEDVLNTLTSVDFRHCLQS